MTGYGTATNDIHPRLSDAEMMANLRKENAKLRYELAKWERLTANIELPEYPSAFKSAFADRMREIGLEVKP